MEKEKNGLSGGLDTYDCRVCKTKQAGGWTYQEMRACMKGSKKRWAVEFGNDQPSIMLSRRELCCLLPQEDSYKYLMARMASSNGKMICPVPLVDAFFEIVPVLQAETDMCNGDGGWGIAPFDGPTSDWPSDAVTLLRHVRAQKGLAQKRRFDEMESKQEAAKPPQPQGLVSG